MCTLSYLPTTAYAPYYIAICGLSGSTVFFHIISRKVIFSGKKSNIKCVFWFSFDLFFCNIFHYKKNSARYYHKWIYVFVSSTRYSCPILMKRELTFPDRFLKKYSNIEFHENPSSGSWVVPCGPTDMTKLIAAFRNFEKAPKNLLLNNNVKLS